MSEQTQPRIYLPDVVGRGYKAFWESKHRYLVCKGSRASKKSTTAALKIIYRMMQMPLANTLVVRRQDVHHADTTYAQLLWAIGRLGVTHLWKANKNPLRLTYTPTGQIIIFRGLDDPQSLASLVAPKGHFTFVWVEEAFQIENEARFQSLDESIRGMLPEGYYHQIILTFNPWHDRIWLKSRFFDDPDAMTLSMTTNYLCNEWLSEGDLANFERMRVKTPKRYLVAGKGEWGTPEGTIYEDWETESFDLEELRRIDDAEAVFGLDFGYTNDPSALFCGIVSLKEKKIWVFDEVYSKGLSNRQLYDAIQAKGYREQVIRADNNEPKSIEELYQLGLRKITRARKGKDSIMNGIQWIQDMSIVIHPSCVNFIHEISNYAWEESKAGEKMNKPAQGYDHLMDAMRYAIETYVQGKKFSF